MAILFRCTCGRAFHVKEEFAGRRARCSCGNSMIVPQATAPADTEVDVLRVLLADELSHRGETDIREEPAVRQPPRRPQPIPSPVALSEAEPVGRFRAARPERPHRSRPAIVVNSRLVTGLLMMAGAAVWFFVGLAAGIIFFYPPILFVLGIATFFQGFGSGE